MRSSRLLLVLTIVSLFLGAIYWIVLNAAAERKPTELDLRRALRTSDHQLALAIIKQLLKEQGEQPSLLMKAGEAASKLNNFSEAISFYDRVPDDRLPEAAIARWAVGEIHLHQRHMSPAIAHFTKSIELDNSQVNARTRLIYLLNLAGRRWDAVPHLFELLRYDQHSVQHLLYLGNTSKSIENEKELQEFLTAYPDDQMPKLGLARIRLRAGAFKDARQYLEDVLQQQPELVEAHIQLGKLLLDSDPLEIPTWNLNLPPAANAHPEAWAIRGQWAKNNLQSSAAMRCFAEAIRLDSDHLPSLYALAQLTPSLGQSDHAKPFIERAALLEKLLQALEQIMVSEWEFQRLVANSPANAVPHKSQKDLEPIKLAAKLTLQLGRPWESTAWAQYGLSFAQADSELPGLFKQSMAARTPQTPRSQATQLAISLESMRAFNLPNYDAAQASISRETNNEKDPGSKNELPKIHFQEIDDVFGFSYFASRKSPKGGRKMFEFTGGGVGILDYDADGWPDVYLAQGCTFPFDGSDTAHCDCLSRNRGEDSSRSSLFQNISASARIQEADFGQGVTIGDINSDGFDDVYVCNIGKNRLWINLGDGTFVDGSPLFATKPEDWTASAAIADLNGDGQAEIYDANYVTGADVYTRLCNFRGQQRACSPLNFQRVKGCLWAADSDGIFHEIGNLAIDASVQEGNALGLIVFRMGDQQTPSIFIANDQVANLLLTSKPDIDSPLGLRFQDSALLSGVAYDSDGKAQACMGIAAGDVNDDGALDFVVTNYFDESNTLYLQQPGKVFQDASKLAGLVGPSTKMLGFGTQFIDADLNGELDLIVLNGHVDDMTYAGIPFRMRPQFFHGDGQGHFDEQTHVGTFFELPQLGRALAWFDFDLDGRQDFVATDLDTPTRLVRNESEVGNFLNLRLVGKRSHRDAIGTEVIVTCGDKKWTKQLTAGCGYMATNSKALHFGLGNADKVDAVDVLWPSGIAQHFVGIAAGSYLLAIEGDSQLRSLRK